MEEGRSEAPPGMLFEVILEPLGRQIVEKGGFQNSFLLCVFGGPKRGGGAARRARDVGGVVPLKYWIELHYWLLNYWITELLNYWFIELMNDFGMTEDWIA